MQSKIKTIISDLGGVYLNRGIWLFWDYLNSDFGIPQELSKAVFLKNYKSYFSGLISEEVFWSNLLKEINLNEDWKVLRAKLLNFFEVNKEVSQVYSKLRKSGLKIVLLSDQSRDWWPELDAKFDLANKFDEIVVSALVGLHKPDPEIYKYTARLSKSAPSECLYVDDIDYNLTPALELGMTTLLFKTNKEFIKDLNDLGVL